MVERIFKKTSSFIVLDDIVRRKKFFIGFPSPCYVILAVIEGFNKANII